MHYLLTLLRFVVVILTVQSETALTNWAIHRGVQDVLEKMILRQDHRRCSSLDTTYQRFICEIWDEADEISLTRMTCSGECSGAPCVSTHRSFMPCPDGSFNKTCIPHDDGKAYTCACHTAKQPDPFPGIYQWDSEWRDITSGRQGLFRQLCNQITQQCVATEYLFGVAHLVKYIPLPDENIHASSEIDSRHDARKVRIDNYFDPVCAWVGVSTSYIQFDFTATYVVLGILIRARCDPSYHNQRVTKVNIQYSQDGAVWNYITPLDVYPEYGNTVTYTQYNDSFTYFFEEATIGRHWRIVALKYTAHPAMKADFIGKVSGRI